MFLVKKEMNKTYELVVILDPEANAEEQEKLLAKIKKIVADAEGKVSQTKELGKKELFSPISKKKAGIFYVLNFSAPGASVASIRQKLQLEEKILRFLLVAGEGAVSAKSNSAPADQESPARKAKAD